MRHRMNAALAGGLLCLSAGATSAEEARYRFEWQGGGGYVMRGGMSFDADLLSGGIVMASDLTCFFIEGSRDGDPVGRWALSMLNEETSWVLTFLPQSSEFAVFGEGAMMPQAWNMDGFGTDCGAGGFGFNIGNAAQDLCIDGTLILASQVPPERPFPALRDDALSFPADACTGPLMMSALSPISSPQPKDLTDVQ
ncbi:hypothetical protein [Salipiger bermudensis]|uniref:hypothetical protein n=1 Tax=Salipiger bermudensis TaxID=344736 RepID=UPI0021BDB70E|nr:hypothetical protein [Salipiger bermudensis]